jgi:hypothetical protein
VSALRAAGLLGDDAGLRTRIEVLFSGGPDAACHTVWKDGVEHVAVPLDDLRAVLDVTAAREDGER